MMIRDFFSFFYDNCFYEEIYYEIFSHLYENWGYVYFGLIAILIPIIFAAAFYFLYRSNPYSKWWHWVITLLISLVAVFGLTRGIARTEILASDNPQLIQFLQNVSNYEYASTLTILIASLNILYALILFLIFSCIFKRYSKLHGHIPI